jgi:hypothetical protein
MSGIRTDDPGFRASEDSSCLRRLCYRDRQQREIRSVNYDASYSFVSMPSRGQIFSATSVFQLKSIFMHKVFISL